MLLLLLSCKSGYYEDFSHHSHYTLSRVNPHKASDSLIWGYRQKLTVEINKVIATTAQPLTRDNSQSTLGNFVCDAMMFAAKREFKKDSIDLVIINRGGLRTNLPKGEITVGNAFEVMPFENQLVLVKISGKKLLSGIKTISEKRHSFMGMKLTLIHDSVIELLVSGKPVNVSYTYNIATSDYLANSGDNFTFLNKPIELNISEVKIREAIIAYCAELAKNGKQIIPYTDDRLKETK